MAKKRRSAFYALQKPLDTAHPSLNLQRAATTASHAVATGSSSSISARLDSLRRATTAPWPPTAAGCKTASAPLSGGLGDSIHRHRHPHPHHHGHRAAAGPAAPPSWEEPASCSCSLTGRGPSRQHADGRGPHLPAAAERPRRLGVFPTGPLRPVDGGSLLAMTLRRMARHWAWHERYDGLHLAGFPARLKAHLLAHLAVYGRAHEDGGGVGLDGLRALFAPPTPHPHPHSHPHEDAVTHLDLSYSITRSLSLAELQRFLLVGGDPGPDERLDEEAADAGGTSQAHRPLPHVASPSSSSDDEDEDEDDDDDWETQADQPRLLVPLGTRALSGSGTLTLRFPHLSHLSLSHPLASASWPTLLAFLPHVPTLTHLSLAYWPPPSLSSPPATVVGGGVPRSTRPTLGWPSLNHDETGDARDVLRRLSRSTYCLTYLDLSGCHAWLWALSPTPTTPTTLDLDRADHGPEWTRAWRGLRTLVLAQPEDCPSCYLHHSSAAAAAAAAVGQDDFTPRSPPPLPFCQDAFLERGLAAEVAACRAEAGAPYLAVRGHVGVEMGARWRG
ncbi:MAG: hypothetical protein M1826_003248 [Phylliscum demangeonii]|nr:MAG: hypothetical protein M1826_003248 [Phylliscum demangeonii]